MELKDVITQATGWMEFAETSFGDESEDAATEWLKKSRDLLMEFFNVEQDEPFLAGQNKCPACGKVFT